MSDGSGCAGDWHVAWNAALDSLELEADEVERLLHDRDRWDSDAPLTSPAFQPPAGLGPLPLELADRARRLLQRQLALSAELTTAMYANRQQVVLAAKLHQADTDPRPVFVDRTG